MLLAMLPAVLVTVSLWIAAPATYAQTPDQQVTTTVGTVPSPSCEPYEGLSCQGWFTDDAGVVDDDQRVEDAIDRVIGRYGHQIAVVVVDASPTGDPRGFAQGLGDAWGVGDPERNDGIVVLVDLGARRTEVVTGPGVSVNESRIAGAGNSFFGVDDFEGGLLAIIGSLEQDLAGTDGDSTDGSATDGGGSGGGTDGSGWGTDFLLLLGVGGLAVGGLTYRNRRKQRHETRHGRRRALVDEDLALLEVAGHDLPRLDEYTVAPPPTDTAATVGTGRGLQVLATVAEGGAVTDDEAVHAALRLGLLVVVDRNRLAAETEVPLELRAADERPLLEGAVQQAAQDALDVAIDDDALFEVRRLELQRVVQSLRPHRVAAARQRTATALINRLATTSVGEVTLTDNGERLVGATAALDPESELDTSVAELAGVYETAQRKTGRMEDLYQQLPEAGNRPAVAAALTDLVDDPWEAVARYERVRTTLEREGDALVADGLEIPALAALLLMNNDDDDLDEFVEAYRTNRSEGSGPGEAVEYALAGLRTRKEIDHVRKEAERLDLPVAITAALLRRRDDGPEVYTKLVAELVSHRVTGDTSRTIAGLLAISTEPVQAIRRWLEARQALAGLGLKGAYADVAAAFGASDPRGPRMFALAYAAQRQSLARSSVSDADRFAPELAHEGTRGQEDSWTGDPIPSGLASFDPFTLMYFHWVITRGHHGAVGWEPLYRDSSWSEDRSSWWGGTGGFGGFGGGGGFSGAGSGSGGSSWDSGSSWGGSGFGGGFSGGGGFGGGGGSSW